MRGRQSPFIGGTIEQTFGGGFIHPSGDLQAEASPYGQFGQGFPQGGLQSPVPQQVPVVQGQVMYTMRESYAVSRRNPNWPLQGPRDGQMWLQ